MKKFDLPSDDFFRESLRNHRITPSDAARKAFLQEARGTIRSGRASRRGRIVPALLLFLAGSAWLIRALLPGEEATPTSVQPKSTPPHTLAASTKPEPPAGSGQAAAPVIPDSRKAKPAHSGLSTSLSSSIQKKPANQNNLAVDDAKAGTGNPGFPGDEQVEDTPSTPGQQESNEALPIQERVQENQVTEQETSGNQPMALLPARSGSPAAPDSSDPPGTPEMNISAQTQPVKEVVTQPPPPGPATLAETSAKQLATPKSYSGSRRSLAGGIYFTPEWIQNTLDGSNLAYNFGLEGVFRYGGFSIRTGAGISIASGANEIEAAYNAYLGDYHKLDSIQFTWSTPEQKYIPKMFMSQQDVFDTLTAYDYVRVKKRYTYLRIPLVFGYDFWKTEKLSLGVRVGPVLSLLLSTKQLSQAFDPGKNRLIQINDISPGQLNLNWQLMGGLGLSVRLTRTLLLNLEPEATYYFNSAFERSANRQKPWSAGFRTALMIEL